jgi:2-oxoglutarate ferredoxin oxidoreductase subunit alpha
MVPVVILSDGYLGEGAEPWRIPDVASLGSIDVEHPTDPKSFAVYGRDERLVRPWGLPGTPGLEHRIGGLEKQHGSGNVSYDPENHQLMTMIRKEKVERVADEIEPIEPFGDPEGDLLVLGWGGTYGVIATAVDRVRQAGNRVAAAHLRHLNPLPRNLGEVLRRYTRVLVPELNSGQLRFLIRARFLVDARGLNKIQGKPFLVEEIEQAMDLMLTNQFADRQFLLARHQQVRLDDQDYDYTLVPDG